jgi:hypothetical protein
MRASAWLLSAVLAGVVLPGCKSSSAAHTYPADPLFVSKKPIESKAENTPPLQVAYAEPAAPTLPLALRRADGDPAVTRAIHNAPSGTSTATP